MMMKHSVSFVLLGLGAVALGGCPIYSDDSRYAGAPGCVDAYGCNGTSPGLPPVATCARPSDCASGTTCGADNRCHTGDCATLGCPSSFVCKLVGGAPRCEAVAGNVGVPSTCAADGDCPTPAGSKCLSGACVAPADQCADATQCAAGSQCVQGACTPSCGATKACPAGYGCDAAKGVCTGNPTACTSASQCAGGATCVAQHCVAPCGAGATCQAGLLCVDGGCIPDQKPVFTCGTDGAQDKCKDGSLCLRHSCYIACDADAGADACKSADVFNLCKTVTTTSGPHSVCGSDSNLGTECDPTQNKSCAGVLVCIDGFCR
jgi:hypothetical protein